VSSRAAIPYLVRITGDAVASERIGSLYEPIRRVFAVDDMSK
jgi:hypothetical protein